MRALNICMQRKGNTRLCKRLREQNLFLTRKSHTLLHQVNCTASRRITLPVTLVVGPGAIREHITQAASVITDVRSIRAVIGRGRSQTDWEILNRSSALSAHAAFEMGDDDSDDGADGDLF